MCVWMCDLKVLFVTIFYQISHLQERQWSRCTFTLPCAEPWPLACAPSFRVTLVSLPKLRHECLFWTRVQMKWSSWQLAELWLSLIPLRPQDKQYHLLQATPAWRRQQGSSREGRGARNSLARDLPSLWKGLLSGWIWIFVCVNLHPHSSTSWYSKASDLESFVRFFKMFHFFSQITFSVF